MNSTSTPPGAVRPPGSSGTAGFFDSLRASGLVRPAGRSGAGVCAAVGNRIGIDPALVRVGIVLVTVFGGLGLLAYGLAWLLFPDAEGRIHAEELLSSRLTSGAFGAAAAIFLGFGGFGSWWFGPDGSWGPAIAVTSVVGVVLLIVWAVQNAHVSRGEVSAGQPDLRPSTPSATPTGYPSTATAPSRPVSPNLSKGERVDLGKGAAPTASWPAPHSGSHTAPRPPAPVVPVIQRRPSAGPAGTALVSGLALLCAAALLLTDRVQPLDAHVPVLAAGSALAVVGLGIVALGLRGRRAGGLTAVAIIALVITGMTWVGAQAGDRVGQWQPGDDSVSFDEATWELDGVLPADRSYSVDMGSGTLDLSGMEPLPVEADVKTITADVRFGEMIIQVPDDLTVELDLDAGFGGIALRGLQERDTGTTTTVGPPGEPDLRIEGRVSFGELVIEDVSR